MPTYRERARAREVLDRRAATMKPVSQYTTPRSGWVRAVREALGMSAADLGRLMGVSRASVRSLEKNELSGSIQLSTLKRAAEAMGCTLIYALVPNESLDATVRREAHSILREQWLHVNQSMALEDQATRMTRAEEQAQLEAVISSGRLWSERNEVE